ncbi:MAG: P-loop NTPase [Planctomycetes bacterium]|nr:P-loop NTPase [Planctomycetota bacterium]
MDPRLSVVGARLAGAARIIGVTGGKGGIGKSCVASALALALARGGRKAGLLDLDLTGPTDHVILGAAAGFPQEVHGVEPPLCSGVRFMSVTCFSGERPVPLRGADVTNALLEILAITRWGELDALIIDMPPGLGDAAMDCVRLIPRAEYLVVANASRVVQETVRRNLRLLTELKVPVRGVVENMGRGGSDEVRRLAAEHGAPFLGSLPFDETLEETIGSAERLARTPFFAAVRALGDALLA